MSWLLLDRPVASHGVWRTAVLLFVFLDCRNESLLAVMDLCLVFGTQSQGRWLPAVEADPHGNLELSQGGARWEGRWTQEEVCDKPR